MSAFIWLEDRLELKGPQFYSALFHLVDSRWINMCQLKRETTCGGRLAGKTLVASRSERKGEKYI